MQVSPMQHQMRRAVTLNAAGAKLEPVPGLPSAPTANLPLRWNDLDARQRRLEAERIEDAGAVRADLDAGSDLLEFVGLLEHLHVDATAQQRQRGGEPADSGADHQHF